jgi:hypothetical protein
MLFDLRAHVEYEKRKKAVRDATSWAKVGSFFLLNMEASQMMY